MRSEDASIEQQLDPTVHVKPRHGPVATMRRAQIQIMLMRCQVLSATIQSMLCAPRNTSVGIHYESMRQLALEAYSVAEGVHSPGLQARCLFWAGWAYAGTGETVVAAEQLTRAKMLDCGEERICGLTAAERRELDALLGRICLSQQTAESNRGLQILHVLEVPGEQEQLDSRRGDTISRDGYYSQELMTLGEELECALSGDSDADDGLEDGSDYLRGEEVPASPEW